MISHCDPHISAGALGYDQQLKLPRTHAHELYYY